MSAFVVNDETINRILAWCESTQFIHDSAGLHLAVKDFVGAELWAHVKAGDIAEPWQTLGHQMHELNIAAVHHRYAHNAEALRSMIEERYPYRYGPAHTGLVSITALACGRPAGAVTLEQAYKHLRCWLYQCTEGEQFETDPLYVRAETLAGYMAQVIADKAPGVHNAEWEARL